METATFGVLTALLTLRPSINPSIHPSTPAFTSDISPDQQLSSS